MVNLNKTEASSQISPQMNPLSVKKHLADATGKSLNTLVEEAKQEGIEIGKKIASQELENEQKKMLTLLN